VGDVVVSHAIALGDGACVEGRAEIPGVMPHERACDEALAASFDGKRVRVANTLAITTDDALASRYGEAGFDVEHLEAFALDAVPPEIPCVAVLAVANRVGRGARAEWKANAARAHEALGDVVRRALNVAVNR
jgi:nucleoside phosphorylase